MSFDNACKAGGHKACSSQDPGFKHVLDLGGPLKYLILSLKALIRALNTNIFQRALVFRGQPSDPSPKLGCSKRAAGRLVRDLSQSRPQNSICWGRCRQSARGAVVGLISGVFQASECRQIANAQSSCCIVDSLMPQLLSSISTSPGSAA